MGRKEKREPFLNEYCLYDRVQKKASAKRNKYLFNFSYVQGAVFENTLENLSLLLGWK